MIKENLAQVHERINAACARCGRTPDKITLVSVSKTKPFSMIEECIAAGEHVFGENYVQELCEKYAQCQSDSITWHMIGHLQRNKVKYIVDKVYMIHSVDSLRLAEEISKEAGKKGVTVSILIEINVAEEETKFGTTCEEACRLVEEIAKLPHLVIKGLMTIAPYVENPEENKQYFEKLRQIYVDINRKNIDNVYMAELSMGMTGDYEVAVTEGATYVRVGTGIFGERFYTG